VNNVRQLFKVLSFFGSENELKITHAKWENANASARLPVCERGLFGKQIDELRQEEQNRPEDGAKNRSEMGLNGV